MFLYCSFSSFSVPLSSGITIILNDSDLSQNDFDMAIVIFRRVIVVQTTNPGFPVALTATSKNLFIPHSL